MFTLYRRVPCSSSCMWTWPEYVFSRTWLANTEVNPTNKVYKYVVS